MQRLVEASANFPWQFHWLRVAEDLDRLACLIHDHGAVFAMPEMAFQFCSYNGIEIAVDVV